MNAWFSRASLLIALLTCASCSRQVSIVEVGASWSEIEKQASGTTVRMAMWDGDPLVNAYMRGYVRENMKTQYDIDVEYVSGQGNLLVNRMMVELDAGKTNGDIDLMWINGETFYQLRQINALYGPFTQLLPNNQLIDWSDPFISVDFQQPIEGYECPWGNVQLALIYNPEKVTALPQNKEQLADWIKMNPGRFTFDTSFTGLTFLKCLLFDFAGGPGSLRGKFNEEEYGAASKKLWNYLRDLKPYLWRAGETFPEDVAQLHQLFANGEIDFSMSNNDGEVDNKALQGIIPDNSIAYVWESGTIRNSHYLGIPINAPNKPAALLLANFLISPEAQLKKANPQVWGDGSVLDLDKLPEEYKRGLAAVSGRVRVASREELLKHALMEPAPEIMIRLHADFRKTLIEGQ